jgi:hypothetical protein
MIGADHGRICSELSFVRRRRGSAVLGSWRANSSKSKLDRLSRNLAFIATLMDSGVELVAVDNPHGTPELVERKIFLEPDVQQRTLKNARGSSGS